MTTNNDFTCTQSGQTCKCTGSTIDVGTITTSCSNVTQLDLSGNAISDISPLASLTQLTHLDLSCNVISDISPLTGLGKLTHLNLYWQKDTNENPTLSNVTGLEKLTQLTYLNLNFNSISSVAGFENLTQLTHLDLTFNQISDINPLKGLTKLKYLDLFSNKISVNSCNLLLDMQKIILYNSGESTNFRCGVSGCSACST